MSLTPRMLKELRSVQSLFNVDATGRDKDPVPKSAQQSPIVTIFGAGVAGLSAAHELIERGFAVQVVEPTRCPDEEQAAEVGGLARNQFGRVPENAAVLHAEAVENKESTKDPAKFNKLMAVVKRLRSTDMEPVQTRFAVPWRIRFERGAKGTRRYNANLPDQWGVRNDVKLHAAWHSFKQAYRLYDTYVSEAERRHPGQKLEPEWRSREVLYVEVRGHSNGDLAEERNRRTSLQWAKEVIDELANLATDVPAGFSFKENFVPVGVGSAEPVGDQRDERARQRSNRVEFRIVEQVVPGEHGYRFFPAFYRHLFDTMRRTPILDADDHATGQTAYDRLVATPDLGLALGDGRKPASLQTRRVRSVEELRRLGELFFSRLGVTHRDVARFQTRMLKFLTSSPERRAREYEQQSWWTFLGGDDERGYSPQMRHYLMETSQALVAMNAEETDARSQGNIVSQLQLHYLEDRTDFTLNGPTSDVWLRPWKRYLERQGVRFFVGELGRLRWDDKRGDLIPETGHKSGWLQAPLRAPSRGSQQQAVQAGPAPTAVARPEKRKIEIEVLDSDDGDYIIEIAGAKYCYTAVGSDRTKIAQSLAREVSAGGTVWAIALGTRIVICELRSSNLPNRGANHSFDDSEAPNAGAVVREIRDAWVTRGISPDMKKNLIDRLTAHDDQLTNWLDGDHPHESDDLAVTRLEPGLTDQEWVCAGRLRDSDEDFGKQLENFEKRWRREIVPRISVDRQSNDLVLRLPEWVEAAIASEGPSTRLHTVWPYRGRAIDKAGTLPASIMIAVSNAHNNLLVIDDPIAEDPDHNYYSALDRQVAFQPDFYVLALPLPAASRLVWSTEIEHPGRLHGCLAEILEFDRRTYRRTMKGREIRVQRDPHGRPPFEHPMRDFAGIQYYFHNQVRLGKGHIYFPRAEWGLSSISQLAYWRERMSPAGPFMGQLSVDIGNFYMTAPARLGNRTGRSTWNSTREDIAAEVWFQVRQGLDRERAGELVSPGFYHIDQGLQFDHPLGSTFRNEVRITVMDAAGWHTLWINGQRFAYEGRAQAVAETLCRQINESGSGALYAEATLKAPGIWQMHVTSKVPEGAALVIVEGDLPGRFEISLNASTFRCVESPSSLAQTRGVRDKLFEALVGDPSLPVISELSGKTGILLLPRGAAELPPIRVRNDHQQLQIVYGPTLHVRIEQCHGGLAFEAPASATVGYNDTPFLINVPGQWRYRPGLFMPAQLTFQDTVLRPEEDERIRYRISNRRWVAAGTYMATTTQLTTMESANESARHAVNAILRCLAFGSGSDYNAQGQVYADLAEIWDPEKNELDDLEPLKRLDAKLVAEGLPHVMDILKIVDQVDSMPMHGKPSRDPAANALHLLQHLADGSDRDWSFLKQTLGDLASQAVERVHDVGDPLGVLRELRHDGQGAIERIRQLLQTVMGRPGGGAGDGRRSPT